MNMRSPTISTIILALALAPQAIIGQTASRIAQPVILDVADDGYHLTSVADGVRFDLNSDGIVEQLAWTSRASDDAFLAIDENRNGRIDDGSELIGGPLGPPNGIYALSAFDGFATAADLSRAANRHADGHIDPSDEIFRRLLLWTDSNHNGISEEPELESVAHAGFVKIYLRITVISQFDSYGNLFYSEGAASLRNSYGVEVNRRMTTVRLQGQ